MGLDTKNSMKGKSVLLLDIDRFKEINDSRGHAAGDTVLQIMGQLLREAAQELSGKAYRLGGDEFVLLTPVRLTEAQLWTLQRVFEWRVRDQLEISGCQFSQGQASEPQDGQSLSEVLESADRQLYQHKKAKKAEYRQEVAGPAEKPSRLREIASRLRELGEQPLRPDSNNQKFVHVTL